MTDDTRLESGCVGEGDCEDCGSELVMSFLLGHDEDTIEVVVVCPNCDQIDAPEDVIRPDVSGG